MPHLNSLITPKTCAFHQPEPNLRLAYTLRIGTYVASPQRNVDQKIISGHHWPKLKRRRLKNMKRIVGSFAALVLALTMGVAAYGKASPRQNQKNVAQTASAKTSKKTMNKTKKRNRRTRHHKGHSKQNTAKSTPKK